MQWPISVYELSVGDFASGMSKDRLDGRSVGDFASGMSKDRLDGRSRILPAPWFVYLEF